MEYVNVAKVKVNGPFFMGLNFVIYVVMMTNQEMVSVNHVEDKERYLKIPINVENV